MSAIKLATIMEQDLGYNEKAKAAFHREAKAVLKKVAKSLGLNPGDYDLRSNKAGIAVSGEVTLHTDKLYVQVSQGVMGRGGEVLFRSCEGRKDYTGGQNRFASAGELLDDSVLSSFDFIQSR